MALTLTSNEKGIGMELKKTVRLLAESREEAALVTGGGGPFRVHRRRNTHAELEGRLRPQHVAGGIDLHAVRGAAPLPGLPPR